MNDLELERLAQTTATMFRATFLQRHGNEALQREIAGERRNPADWYPWEGSLGALELHKIWTKGKKGQAKVSVARAEQSAQPTAGEVTVSHPHVS